MNMTKKLSLGGLAGVFITAAVLHFQGRDPSLTPEGEEIRDTLLQRMKANLAYGEPSDADHCAARYIAHQQAGRLEQDKKFIPDARESGHGEDEINRVVAVNHRWDSQYALYVYMTCATGQKPALFSPRMFAP